MTLLYSSKYKTIYLIQGCITYIYYVVNYKAVWLFSEDYNIDIIVATGINNCSILYF